MSADTDDDDKDHAARVKKLTARRDELKLRNEIAAEQVAMFKLDASAVTAPGGLIQTNETAPIDATLLVYDSLKEVSAAVVQQILRQCSPTLVVLVDDEIANAQSALEVFYTQAMLLKGEVSALLSAFGSVSDNVGAGEELALAAVGSAVVSAMQVAALFRVDQSFTNFSLTVEEQSAAVAVASAFRDAGVAATTSWTSSLEQRSWRVDVEELRLVRELKELGEARLKLKAAADGYRPIQSLDSANEQASGVLGDGSPDVLLLRAQSTLERAAAFEASVLLADVGSPRPRFSQLVAAERLSKELTDSSVLLRVRVVAAGGGTAAKSGILRSSVIYSGGVGLVYVAYDMSGKLVDSGLKSAVRRYRY